MPTPIEDLQERLSYRFRDPALLELALTHPSFLAENPETQGSNQRLEFLGDAVLQLILTQALFECYPQEREGVLSKRRSLLSKGVTLAELGREIDLGDCLRMGQSEVLSGGNQRLGALEDAFEALIGALSLDTDFATVRRIVLDLYGPLEERINGAEQDENPKGRLQELIQPEHGNNALRYDLLRTSGENHARIYDCGVWLNERQIGAGTGPSKKIAEEAAARQALATLAAESSPPA